MQGFPGRPTARRFPQHLRMALDVLAESPANSKRRHRHSQVLCLTRPATLPDLAYSPYTLLTRTAACGGCSQIAQRLYAAFLPLLGRSIPVEVFKPHPPHGTVHTRQGCPADRSPAQAVGVDFPHQVLDSLRARPAWLLSVLLPLLLLLPAACAGADGALLVELVPLLYLLLGGGAFALCVALPTRTRVAVRPRRPSSSRPTRPERAPAASNSRPSGGEG
jgi:hypothetical protein